MNVLYVVSDDPKEWNSAEWRCVIPSKAIADLEGHDAKLIGIGDWINSAQVSREANEWADVIVVQRLLIGVALSMAFHWKMVHNKTVILDVDDAYHLIESGTPAYTFWKEGKGFSTSGKEVNYGVLPYKSLFTAGKIINAVSAPSEGLLEHWQPYTDHWVYLPNYMDMPLYTGIEKTVNRRPIVGWGGSAQHYHGLEDTKIVKALSRLVKMRPEVIVMVVWSARFFNMLAKEIGSMDNIVFQPKVVFAEWPKTLQRFDVGLAPLHGPYDACRSEIKVLEYMAMKIPWVASAGFIYDRYSSFGHLVKDTAKEWLDAIIDQLDHPDPVKIDDGFELSKVWDINYEGNAQGIIDIYQKVREGAI